MSLRAWDEDDALVIEVEDDGSGFAGALPGDESLPDPDRIGGRGLFLVQALADDVDVRAEDGRTVVRAVKRAVFAPT